MEVKVCLPLKLLKNESSRDFHQKCQAQIYVNFVKFSELDIELHLNRNIRDMHLQLHRLTDISQKQ